MERSVKRMKLAGQFEGEPFSHPGAAGEDSCARFAMKVAFKLS